jgi:hypothetical protein
MPEPGGSGCSLGDTDISGFRVLWGSWSWTGECAGLHIDDEAGGLDWIEAEE